MRGGRVSVISALIIYFEERVIPCRVGAGEDGRWRCARPPTRNATANRRDCSGFHCGAFFASQEVCEVWCGGLGAVVVRSKMKKLFRLFMTWDI